MLLGLDSGPAKLCHFYWQKNQAQRKGGRGLCSSTMRVGSGLPKEGPRLCQGLANTDPPPPSFCPSLFWEVGKSYGGGGDKLKVDHMASESSHGANFSLSRFSIPCPVYWPGFIARSLTTQISQCTQAFLLSACPSLFTANWHLTPSRALVTC